MHCENDIRTLRVKSQNIASSKYNKARSYKNIDCNYGNIDSNHRNVDINSGLIYRIIISLCLLIALIVCRLGVQEQSAQVFQTVQENIAVNEDLRTMPELIKDKVSEWLSEF